MKVTNFEISKKLKEIGFNKSSILGHFSSKCGGGGVFFVNNAIDDEYTLDCYAYVLETLLAALPEHIIINLDACYGELGYELFMKKDQIYYSNDVSHFVLGECKKENESLADCAGRLLILLHEKGIINFNK